MPAQASTTSGTGKLTVTGAVQTANDGYVRLAADKDVVIDNTVTANGSGNLVVTAGLGGTGNLTQGANGALTSGSGEINLRAQNDIALGANVSTGGNVLAQAVTGAITQSGGVLSADQAALTSAGAELLATSDTYVHAFRLGSAVAVQFHPEAGPELLASWAHLTGGDPDAMSVQGEIHDVEAAAVGQTLVNKWLESVRADPSASAGP